MKDDIRNIINLDSITRMRGSMSVNANLPLKGSLVKLIPLEYLEQGVKVLIDGKLFIAFIDGNIPIKEEIIALVTCTSPISLSLNLSSKLNNDNGFLIDQIIKRLSLKNDSVIRNNILKVIEEGNVLIKSKIIILSDLTRYISVDGLELSLLINLVWNNHEKNKNFIEDLYDNLFDQSFEVVCEKLFNSVSELLFANLPQFLSQQLRDNLIYNENQLNTSSLVNKTNQIYDLIRVLNDYKQNVKLTNIDAVPEFIKYGTKYILQKSVLKEYEYYPDFVIIKRESELTIIHYSIKKVYKANNLKSYKIIFKHTALPFQLSGIIRNKFLLGDLELADDIVDDDLINSLEDNLFNHWGFRSDIKKNNKEENKIYKSKINIEINKLVS